MEHFVSSRLQSISAHLLANPSSIAPLNASCGGTSTKRLHHAVRQLLHNAKITENEMVDESTSDATIVPPLYHFVPDRVLSSLKEFLSKHEEGPNSFVGNSSIGIVGPLRRVVELAEEQDNEAFFSIVRILLDSVNGGREEVKTTEGRSREMKRIEERRKAAAADGEVNIISDSDEDEFVKLELQADDHEFEDEQLKSWKKQLEEDDGDSDSAWEISSDEENPDDSGSSTDNENHVEIASPKAIEDISKFSDPVDNPPQFTLRRPKPIPHQPLTTNNSATTILPESQIVLHTCSLLLGRSSHPLPNTSTTRSARTAHLPPPLLHNLAPWNPSSKLSKQFIRPVDLLRQFCKTSVTSASRVMCRLIDLLGERILKPFERDVANHEKRIYNAFRAGDGGSNVGTIVYLQETLSRCSGNRLRFTENVLSSCCDFTESGFGLTEFLGDDARSYAYATRIIDRLNEIVRDEEASSPQTTTKTSLAHEIFFECLSVYENMVWKLCRVAFVVDEEDDESDSTNNILSRWDEIDGAGETFLGGGIVVEGGGGVKLLNCPTIYKSVVEDIEDIEDWAIHGTVCPGGEGVEFMGWKGDLLSASRGE